MGQILDRVFRLIGANLRMFLGLALVPAGTMLGALVAMGGMAVLTLLPELRRLHGQPTAADFLPLLWLIPPAVVLYCCVFAVYAVYGAAASYAVVKTHRGEPVTGAEAWTVARKGAERYIWLMFLLILILAGPIYLVMGGMGAMFAAVAIPAAHGGSAAPFAFFALMPMLSILNLVSQVYMVWMFLCFGLAIPACVMENLPAAESLKRSAALTRGGRGRFFVVMLVMYAATFVLILVSELVLLVLAGIGVFAGVFMHITLHSPVLLFFFVPAGLVVLLVLLLFMFALPYVGYSTLVGVVYCDQKWRFGNTTVPAPAAGGLT